MDNSRDGNMSGVDSKISITNISSIHESTITNGEGFWNLLQTDKGVEIPVYIKNILTFNNLDNPLSFQCIDNDALAELEEFARNSMKDFFKSNENLEKYYGRYSRMPNKFRFLIGDRFLIKKLVDYVKKQPDDYWKGRGGILPFNQVYLKGDVVSESEVDDTEDIKKYQQDEPPNRQQEKDDLIRLVKNSLVRDLRDYPHHLSNLKNLRVKVQVKKDTDKRSNTQYFVSTGYVQCILCSVRITIRKHYLPHSNRKPRWVISNFRRHSKSHLKPKDGPVDSPTEDDPEYQDMEVYKGGEITLDNTDGDKEDGEEEDQNEVSYTVTW